MNKPVANRYTSVPSTPTSIDIESNKYDSFMADDTKIGVRIMAAAGGMMGCVTCCTSFVLQCSALPIPILKIVVAHRYGHQCPIEPKIPYFLYISGTVGIAATLFPLMASVLIFIQQIKTTTTTSSDYDPVKHSLLKRMLGLITMALNVILFLWLICGAVWTFGMYDRVTYDPKDAKNYCQRQLFLFTTILLILGFMQVIGQCCCIGIRVRNLN